MYIQNMLKNLNVQNNLKLLNNVLFNSNKNILEMKQIKKIIDEYKERKIKNIITAKNYITKVDVSKDIFDNYIKNLFKINKIIIIKRYKIKIFNKIKNKSFNLKIKDYINMKYKNLKLIDISDKNKNKVKNIKEISNIM